MDRRQSTFKVIIRENAWLALNRLRILSRISRERGRVVGRVKWDKINWWKMWLRGVNRVAQRYHCLEVTNPPPQIPRARNIVLLGLAAL